MEQEDFPFGYANLEAHCDRNEIDGINPAF